MSCISSFSASRCRDLNSYLVLVVDQVYGFYILFAGIQILQPTAKQDIKKMQVKVFRMEMQVEDVKFAAMLDSSCEMRQSVFDIIEIEIYSFATGFRVLAGY